MTLHFNASPSCSKIKDFLFASGFVQSRFQPPLSSFVCERLKKFWVENPTFGSNFKGGRRLTSHISFLQNSKRPPYPPSTPSPPSPPCVELTFLGVCLPTHRLPTSQPPTSQLPTSQLPTSRASSNFTTSHLQLSTPQLPTSPIW